MSVYSAEYPREFSGLYYFMLDIETDSFLVSSPLGNIHRVLGVVTNHK